MAFVAAMNTPLTAAGVKGSDVYTEAGVGDDRVALFQQLVRGCAPSTIQTLVGKAATNDELLVDYAVMAFQTRDIRGGKGERDLFFDFFFALAAAKPSTIKMLVGLIPEYGCWKDCVKLWALSDASPQGEAIRGAILDLVKWIYFEDQAKLDKGEASISLLGKWLPREGSKHHAVAQAFATAFYPDLEDKTGDWAVMRGGKPHDKRYDECWRAYRKGTVRLNAHLKTTEIAMCGHKWASIDPAAVPGRLLAKARKAFLNEIVARKGKPVRRRVPVPRIPAGTLRFPEDPDRMACREHFREHTARALKGEVTVKGGDTVYPHELVRKYFRGACTTDDEDGMIEAQWMAIRAATATSGGLGRAIAMCDFSGSMGGTPMEVSMALGVLISEVTHQAFRDHVIGFDSTPSWISFVGKSTLKEKVRHAQPFAQGLSTNFQAACDLILQRLIEHKVPAAEAPQDLIVLTDMGFDAACGGVHNKKTAAWQTHVQMIHAAFAAAGYTAPRIVLWNLRAEYKDFHARAHDENVVVLSGWSPAILKAISASGVHVTTPYEGLREVLDVPRYDKVRAAWATA